ncbi:MAG: M1 family aminopeptidase [Bacteroidia bacterium]
MKRILVFCIIGVSLVAAAFAQPFPDPAIDVQQYVFRLEINDQNAEIKGKATIAVRFTKEGIETFSLDLVNQSSATVKKGMKVTTIRLDSQEVAFTHRMNRIEIQLATSPAAGSVKTFVIQYEGIPADGLIISENLYGNKTFFGDNWPNRAHNWLPVVDHPLDKALVSFEIIAPQKYQVIANGALKEETDLGDGTRLTRWESNVPLPTKVMVFGAAEFAVQYIGDLHHIPVSSWVYPQNREAGFYDYTLAMKVLTFMDEYIGPYPYEKLANVQSTTRYGGMENASNIFYAENSITGERTSEELIAHEIAHQWFGNSASEASWYHIWLSEGFATYLKHLYMEAAYGEKKLAEGMAVDRETIFQSGPNVPIVNENITNLNHLLNVNSYEKGGWVLHMLRQEVGDEAFHKGIRTYYDKYKLNNALTDDFRKVMEEVSGKELKPFFDQWLFRAGNPKLETGWKYDTKKKKLVVTINQTQAAAPFVFPLEIGLLYEGNDTPEIVKISVSKKQETFELSVKTQPAKVVLDPGVKLLFEVGK